MPTFRSLPIPLLPAVRDLAGFLDARRTSHRAFDNLAQESLIRCFLVHSLLRRKPGLAGTIFTDYPMARWHRRDGTREKLDLVIFLPRRRIILESKYVRSLEAFPDTRGNLIQDVARLFDPEFRARRFLLLVSSSAFVEYLRGKPGFPLGRKSWHGKIADLARVPTERKWLRGWPRITVRVPAMMSLVAHEVRASWHVLLWQVE